MVVLKNISQIGDMFDQFVKLDEKGKLDAQKFVSVYLDDEEIMALADTLDELHAKHNYVEDFSELVFQLRDYLPALSNFVKTMLVSKNFEAVYLFVKKLFVNQIGTIKYASTNGAYSFTERYFDRFIEIVKNCKINPELYLPLIIETFRQSDESKLKEWKMPALEYLQNFFNEKEDWMLAYINSGCDLKYDILESICEFNTSKGIYLLVKDFIEQNNFDYEKNVHVLKNYKRDTMTYLDKSFATHSDDDRIKMVKIYLAFLPDNETQTRLKDIYEEDKSEEVKNLVAQELGITETLSIKSEKQFLYAVRRKIKEPQERALGIPFDRIGLRLKSGYQCDNDIFTFLIYLLKEEKNLANLKKLNIFETIFEKEGLEQFSEKMFDVLENKPDILFAKWAIRLFSLFGNKELQERVYKLISNLIEAERYKEAKYLIESMISAGKEGILDIIRSFLEKNNQFMIENKEYFSQVYVQRNNKTIEEVNDDLVVEDFNEDNVELQTKRLYEAFVSKREYTEHRFQKLFIQNAFLSKLAERLVWGEYNFGRLYNAFKIVEGKKEYIVKTSELTTYSISIIHSQDLDARFDDVVYAIEKPLFTQFKTYCFDVNQFSRMAVNVNRFSGMFVSTNAFCSKLEDLGFKPNKAEDELLFGSMVYEFDELKMLAEIEFEKPVVRNQKFATIGLIFFYKLNDVIKDKGQYITSKSNAVSLGGIPNRLFDYVLSSISDASRMK